MKNRTAEISRLELFIQFFKFGLFTFGGGWSMLTQMHHTYVENAGIISSEELLDITSVGRSLPGAMICNVAMLFGYRLHGIYGGIICVAGMTVPSFSVLCIVNLLYDYLINNLWVEAAMHGVRASVVTIIAGAIIKMCGGAYKYPSCFLVTFLCFLLYSFLNASCVAIVVIGAVFGLAIGEYHERCGGKNDFT